MAERTARLNAIREHLREFGLTIPVGARNVIPRLWEEIEDANAAVPELLRPTLAEIAHQIRELEQRILDIERQLRTVARHDAVIQRLLTIPGVGLLTATPLVAFVGNVKRFPSGRHFASYLGLTPRENSTGARRRLGRISNRGDVYLRMLLIHGARAVLHAARKKTSPDGLRAWALRLQQRCGHNRAAVAVANKMARIVWAVWRHERDFLSQTSQDMPTGGGVN